MIKLTQKLHQFFTGLRTMNIYIRVIKIYIYFKDLLPNNCFEQPLRFFSNNSHHLPFPL